jgi:hypothetical protein
MKLVKKTGVFNMFVRGASLIITDEKTLDNIIEDPAKPLIDKEDRGFSLERRSLYPENTSLLDICMGGQRNRAEMLSVSYDFFFGGSTRENYPDSEKTLKAYKIIHDVAKEHGMGFSASIVSPLDVGGGYVKTHENTGFTCQYMEGEVNGDGGYEVRMDFQTQWMNNKGPAKLELVKVMVYVFNEERIENTNLYYVNPDEIMDISESASYEVDESSIEVSFNGYGHGDITVFGKSPYKDRYKKCMVVLKYRTPELDYFSHDALDYMKGIIDRHKEMGITYMGFYSDEMHIQFDWDLFNHFGETEINTRYVSRGLVDEYARRYGEKYRDFEKMMVFFSYHQHGDNEPSQHMFGKDEKSIYETWLFRKRYFEMLSRQVVDLCNEAKAYAEKVFGREILTSAHATWQESPTCDRFYKEARFSELQKGDISRYDYTPHYYWSSSIRENIAACYDYFRWNEFLTGGGTDHPEGGFIDRNYYSQAFACSLAVLNKTPIAYNGSWGSPHSVLRHLRNVGAAYGNLTGRFEHNLVQAFSPRLTNVLALYPLDLNYVEERFGSWMVQFGYCNYITEEKIHQHFEKVEDGYIFISGRKYSTLLVLFSPFIKKETLELMKKFVDSGGKVVWTSMHPVDTLSSPLVRGDFEELFGVSACEKAYLERTFKDRKIRFENSLNGVLDMEILTDLRPDFVYPVTPKEGTEVAARLDEFIVGTVKRYPSGGLCVYFGARLRDDQSTSTGRDVDTLFSVLEKLGCYDGSELEVMSRNKDSRYLISRFPNGSVSVTNHYRTFYEEWDGKFFRDEKEDEKALEGRILPPVELNLEKFSILGSEISYNGIDLLTYRLDENGNLVGFAGSATTGIVIGNAEYKFCGEKADIAFGVVDLHLEDNVEKLFVVKTNKKQRIKVPFPEDANGFKAYVCGELVFSADREIGFEFLDDSIEIDIDDFAVNKWIAVVKMK